MYSCAHGSGSNDHFQAFPVLYSFIYAHNNTQKKESGMVLRTQTDGKNGNEAINKCLIEEQDKIQVSIVVMMLKGRLCLERHEE